MIKNIRLYEDKCIQDHCGIVGVIPQIKEKILPVALNAAYGLQYRGMQGAGIALQTDGKMRTYKKK